MKKIVTAILAVLLLIIFQTNSYAASLSLGVSKGEVALGDTVSVTVNFGGTVAAADVTVSFDSSKFAYKGVNAGTANSTGSSVKVSYYDAKKGISSITLTFTSIALGSGKFTAKANNTVDINVNPVTVSGSPSKTVTVKAAEKKEEPKSNNQSSKPTTKKETTPKKEIVSKKEETKKEEVKETPKSNNANLSSLNIEGFSLTPEFNKDTTKYSVSVENDISSLNILANTEDSKAKCEVLGNNDFAVGTNIVTVKVTAEDGKVKEYIIEVDKAENIVETPISDNEESPKQSNSSNLGAFFSNSWIVLVVSFCALIQSSIAVYYAVQAYKNSNTSK